NAPIYHHIATIERISICFDEDDENSSGSGENPPLETYTGGGDKILEIGWEMKIDESSTATLICSELGRLV
ncbi:hypothetical protein U1Q18_048862, partial [Sarracenia purpurea var. burkii]